MNSIDGFSWYAFMLIHSINNCSFEPDNVIITTTMPQKGSCTQDLPFLEEAQRPRISPLEAAIVVALD